MVEQSTTHILIKTINELQFLEGTKFGGVCL